MTRTLVLLGATALALAGCKGEEKKTVGGTAQGQVLPGSASDAMLPLDTVTSQPPLAPKSEGGEGEAKPDKAAAKAARPSQDSSSGAKAEEPAPADAPAGEQ